MSLTVYALGECRTRRFADKFLDAFLPHRISATDEYKYPEFGFSPDIVYFNAVGELIAHLENNPDSAYSLYWNPSEAKPSDGIEQAMLFFTGDGGMIGGLAVADGTWERILGKVQGVLGADWAVVTGEEAPPLTVQEFKSKCQSATTPRIVEGIFVAGNIL